MSVNLGRVAYVEKGAYDGGTTYQKKDVVSYNNGSYVYIADAPAAGIVPTDSAYWQPMLDPTSMNQAVATANQAAETANQAANTATTAANAANTAAEAADEARLAISDELNKKAPAIYVDASGDMVTITDGAEGMPVASLITHVEPKETGEGEKSPANPWTIIGWDEVSVNGAGKNIFDVNSIELQPIDINGEKHYGMIIYGADKYTVSCKEYDTYTFIYAKRIKADGSLGGPVYIATNSKVQKYTFEMAENERLLVYDALTASTKENSINHFIAAKTQVEIGDIETAYEPYNGETLTAALPETLYGFDKNWTTGKLYKTFQRIVFDGVTVGKKMDGTDSTPTAYKYVYMFQYNMPAPLKNGGKKYGNITNGVGMTTVLSLSLPLELTGVTSTDDRATVVSKNNALLKQWYDAGTPLEVVYELATPQEIQLTPQQLSTLKGTNNIWSDAGATEVTYAADTKLYADGKDSTAMIGTAEPGMVATKNYASGDFIVVGKSLYKATAAIATGEAITPGTNCTATTVIEQLAAIYNLIK